MKHLIFLCLLAALSANIYARADDIPSSTRSRSAVSDVGGTLESALSEKSITKGAPVFIQILKAENELRLYLEKDDGTYALLETYPICAWSGDLGPKLKEGDGQSPEGFYTIRPSQLNPNSSFHLSFNLGFPNTYDRAKGRTGSFLMVHGNCVSIGCYAMTDPVIENIWTLMVWAFEDGQSEIPVHIFPFEMTDENLAENAENQWAEFWAELAPAWKHFQETSRPPAVMVQDGAYVIAQ